MTEDPSKQPNALEHGDYEREDLSPGGVLYFLAGLAVVGILIYFIVMGMYNFLDRYEREHQANLGPMATPQADTRAVTHADTLAFPQPRLEESERNQLQGVTEAQDSQLEGYDWVDKNKGIVRIPIERAMDLLAERGLPVRPESATSTGSAEPAKAKAPASKAARASGASR